jgi:hypothetical protein
VSYTGPIPPTPTATSTDAQWASWWNYQTQLFRDADLEARAANTAALNESAAAQRAMVTAASAPMSTTPPTDAQLVNGWVGSALCAGVSGFAAVDAARKALAVYRLTYKATP